MSEKRPKGRKPRPAAEPLTLSDIVRGIQYCVNSAYDIVEQQNARALERYFDDQGRPITRRYLIGGEYAMDIPLLALTTRESMGLEEMTVRMSVNVRGTDLKEDPAPSGADYVPTRSCFRVELASGQEKGDGADMDLEMHFKAGDPPEAVSRLMDQLNNCILPQRLLPEDDPE